MVSVVRVGWGMRLCWVVRVRGLVCEIGSWVFMVKY